MWPLFRQHKRNTSTQLARWPAHQVFHIIPKVGSSHLGIIASASTFVSVQSRPRAVEWCRVFFQGAGCSMILNHFSMMVNEGQWLGISQSYPICRNILVNINFSWKKISLASGKMMVQLMQDFSHRNRVYIGWCFHLCDVLTSWLCHQCWKHEKVATPFCFVQQSLHPHPSFCTTTVPNNDVICNQALDNVQRPEHGQNYHGHHIHD